jgi:maltose O-acetyltransferase
MLRHLINLLLWPLPPSRLFLLRRLFLRLAGIDIGSDVSVCGRGWIYGRGRVALGRGTWLSPGVVFHTHLEAPIRIGDRCDVGPAVEFVTGGHLAGDAVRRAGRGTALEIAVGDGTWIGGRALILGGVKIGQGAIVAAGSVVTRDVPANVLVAGVPAVVKKVLTE